MIDKIWGKMTRIGIDKLWHFIAFREITAILIAIPILRLISWGLLVIATLWFFRKDGELLLKIIAGVGVMFTIAVFCHPIIGLLALTVSIGIEKELYDWDKGQYFDFGDLLADVLGIGLGILN